MGRGTADDGFFDDSTAAFARAVGEDDFFFPFWSCCWALASSSCCAGIVVEAEARTAKETHVALLSSCLFIGVSSSRVPRFSSLRKFLSCFQSCVKFAYSPNEQPKSIRDSGTAEAVV
jgi:hypothetical protein